MRSSRPNYASTPAGSSRALNQKPKQRKPKKEWNQLLMMCFFVILPVCMLLAIFFQPIRYLALLASIGCMLVMWRVRAFRKPGRVFLTAIYGLLDVMVLVAILNAQGDRAVNQGVFAQPTWAPTQAPIEIVSYNTQPPIESDDLDMQEIGVAGGSEDQSWLDTTQEDSSTSMESGENSVYTPFVKSEAEEALERFMDKWNKGIIADMVDNTPPSWRREQGDAAETQLFWKFKQKPLDDWRQMSAPTGTDASTARTISIEADITYSGEKRTYQYDAIALMEDGNWYIDPNSLSSGVLREQSTPTPDPNATPKPTPEPTPTPKPSNKTKLYYNKSGGKYYHAEAQCPSVDKKYLPLASFTYGDLNKSPYTKLVPCEKCNAPSR